MRPRLWCPGACGNWADEGIGHEGLAGAVLVVLSGEAYWFCGVACASNCLNELFEAAYEGGASPKFMLLNTLSEN